MLPNLRACVAAALCALTLSVPLAGAAGASSEYVVEAGDTLVGIAREHGVRLNDLLAANGLTATSLILPGQHLTLPEGAAAPAPAAGSFVRSGTRADAAVEYALAQVGKPYVFFTKGPSQFDCSGLTLQAYAQIGIPMVHHAATQAKAGTAVDFWNGSIQTGDLVFLDGDWDGEIDHVGMATGPDTWVHASQSQRQVVTDSLPPRSVIIAVRRYV